jgi:two-component system, chemotaxis family, protein-glutamate methylesterase/glutaminase
MRILIADDAIAYRAIISRALENLPGVEVVGVAANGRIALQKIEQLKPDLVTLDLEMPEMDGLSILRYIRDAKMDVGAIMLSAFTKEGAKATLEALSLGAFDFIVKPSGSDSQTNAEKLRRELRFKIEAYRQAREISVILHGQASQPAAFPQATVTPKADDRVHGPSPDKVFPGHAGRWVSQRSEVVALGISTGGPPALSKLLPQLPANLTAPVLIVQHMPPVFTRSLAEDLDKRCALRVYEATDGQAVLPGTILIAPGGKQMKVEQGDASSIIRITDDPPENSCQPSVDYLFRSVADVYGRRALGVLMTGMGSDGAAGCRLLHRCGAPLLAQDEASCVVFGMPREPIREGIAKAVSLDNMAGEIIRLVGQPEWQLANDS